MTGSTTTIFSNMFTASTTSANAMNTSSPHSMNTSSPTSQNDGYQQEQQYYFRQQQQQQEHEEEERSLAIDRLSVMRLQETKSYRLPTSHLEASVVDADGNFQYNHRHRHHPQPHRDDDDNDDNQCHDDTNESNKLHPAELSVYLSWRRQMVEWSFRIAETCHFSKETVEMAVNLLDRYVATCHQTMMRDATQYQLACMTCLYTCCKVHEPTCLSPQQMEKISGSCFCQVDLERMEVQILKALNWNVHPPTAISFAKYLLQAIGITSKTTSSSLTCNDNNNNNNNDYYHQIMSMVELQVQHATADELFVPVRASGIAFAAILNAVKSITATNTPTTTHQSFKQYYWDLERALLRVMGFDHERSSVRYQQLYMQKMETLQTTLLHVVAKSYPNHGFYYNNNNNNNNNMSSSSSSNYKTTSMTSNQSSTQYSYCQQQQQQHNSANQQAQKSSSAMLQEQETKQQQQQQQSKRSRFSVYTEYFKMYSPRSIITGTSATPKS